MVVIVAKFYKWGKPLKFKPQDGNNFYGLANYISEKKKEKKSIPEPPPSLLGTFVESAKSKNAAGGKEIQKPGFRVFSWAPYSSDAAQI